MLLNLRAELAIPENAKGGGTEASLNPAMETVEYSGFNRSETIHLDLV